MYNHNSKDPTVSLAGLLTQPTLASETEYDGECKCEYHTLLSTASGVYPLCIYNDKPALCTDSKGGNTHLVKKPQEENKEVVMEDGDFFIEKDHNVNPGWDKHESWVMHYCPSTYWKCYMDEQYMMDFGKCKHCDKTIPPGLIALWKMHNWEYLQSGIDSQEDFAVEASCA